jgi:hypothetical protein
LVAFLLALVLVDRVAEVHGVTADSPPVDASVTVLWQKGFYAREETASDLARQAAPIDRTVRVVGEKARELRIRVGDVLNTLLSLGIRKVDRALSGRAWDHSGIRTPRVARDWIRPETGLAVTHPGRDSARAVRLANI